MFFQKLILGVGGALVLSACGGGSGGSDNDVANPPPPTPATVTLSISDSTLSEGDSATSVLAFNVTLSDAAANDVTVDYATANSSAVAGADYTASNGALTIAAGDTNGTIEISILGDEDVEGDEFFTISLSNPSNAAIGTANATGTIIDDDQPPVQLGASFLNDTGVEFCSDGMAEVDCSSATALLGQDGQTGRDATESDASDGAAGFEFTKLDSSGIELADQGADYALTPWSCVRDEITGLVWEVKSDDGGLHDADQTYSRYDSSGRFQHQGFENAGRCSTSGSCDSEKYTAAVNVQQLCGFSDWRVPTRFEWVGLLSYGNATGEPMIDTGYFPHVAERYWTATPAPIDTGYFDLDPNQGSSLSSSSMTAKAVQLVRGESR